VIQLAVLSRILAESSEVKAPEVAGPLFDVAIDFRGFAYSGSAYGFKQRKL
jgi:hypothetical protein